MIRKTITALLAVASVSLLIAAPVANAATDCGGTKTQFIACDSDSGVGAINDLIRIAVIVLSTLIGIAAVGGLVYGAVLYTSARDNQGQVESALTIIRNIVIGLMLYGFTLAILNWLLPGSVIG